MVNRIIELRKINNLSQEKFAEKLNLSRNFINQVETGKKNFSDRTILDICREFNVNEDWLRTGEGEMYSSSSTDFIEIASKIDIQDPKAKQAILDYWNLSDTDKELFWKFMEKFTKK